MASENHGECAVRSVCKYTFLLLVVPAVAHNKRVGECDW